MKGARRFIAAVSVLFSVSAHSTDTDDLSVMGFASISCESYLSHAPDSQGRKEYTAWVSGRIAAIVPAPVQPFLRALPFARLESDLTLACEVNPGEGLFTVSALLANDYRVQAERD